MSRLALVVAVWLAGCSPVVAEPGVDTPAALPDVTAPLPDVTAPEASAVVAPVFERGCAKDDECAVVLAFAGLDAVPADPGAAACGDACYTAIRAADVVRWTEARRDLEGLVPCDKKQAKCGSPSAHAARCTLGRCVVMAR